MARGQSARLDQKKLLADPILVTTIIVLIVFLTLFILYPLAILLVDAVVGESGPTLSVLQRVLAMPSFETAISNTLVLGLFVGIVATLIGLLFAYVEVYVNLKSRFMSGLFKLVSMLPVVSPPFVLSLSVILLFGKAGLITRTLLGIYDNNVYGFWGIALVQTLTFFPVCYMMFRGLLRNIDPSLEEAARDMGASRWKVFTSVTLPLILPGMGNAFLVSFMESIADFANPMIIGGSYDTLATSIYLQITGAYDKQGASAMSCVLLGITLIMFIVQKYVLERKSTATLTGKAARGRMLITDNSVRIPLSVLCGAVAIFVVALYVCVPFGALFKTWGYDYSLTPKWFIQVFTLHHGFEAFADSFGLSLIAAPLTALLSMVIAYLVVKRRFAGRGFIEFVSMLAMAVPGTVLGVGFIRGFSSGVFHTGFMQGLYGTAAILVIVFIVRSLPTGTRSGISALRQIDKSIVHRGVCLRHGCQQLPGLHDRHAAAHQGLVPLGPRDCVRALHHGNLCRHPARHAADPHDYRPDQRVRREGRLRHRLRVRHDPHHHHLRGRPAHEPLHQALRHQRKDQRQERGGVTHGKGEEGCAP